MSYPFIDMAEIMTSYRRPTTNKRHGLVRQKFDELCKIRVQGLPLDMDAIVERVGQEIGYSKRYVEDILRQA